MRREKEDQVDNLWVYSENYFTLDIDKDNTKVCIGLHQKDTRIFSDDKSYHNFETDLQLIVLRLSSEGVQ